MGGIFNFYSDSKANSGEPDQTPRFEASDLVWHCLPMPRKKDARLIWVKDGSFISLICY